MGAVPICIRIGTLYTVLNITIQPNSIGIGQGKHNISNLSFKDLFNFRMAEWTQHVSRKRNQPYWHNAITGKSRWTPPDEDEVMN